jgi:hypothetical protein
MFILLFLSACQSATSIPVASPSQFYETQVIPTLNSTITSRNPIDTLSPTIALTTATAHSTLIMAPSPSETLSPQLPTWEAQPTVIISTAIPIPVNDSFQRDLVKRGYKLGFSTSTVGPGGYIYSAYIFSYHDPASFESPGDYHIAFYRSDGKTNRLMLNFPAPQYPGGSMYSGYQPLHASSYWIPFWYTADGWPHSENGNVQHSFGEWTDINQNGLPELALTYEYCSNACLDDIGEATHFYEIQTSSKVVDITADLPGVIGLILYFHSRKPAEIFVIDPSLWYCYKWCSNDTWWIYAWNGQKFVDVTPKYANEYLDYGARLVRDIQKSPEKRFPEWNLLRILFLYEKAGLRKQAFETFMDISDPSRGPAVHTAELCWLQYARASVSEDYQQGKPFHFPEFRLEGEMVDPLLALQRNMQFVNKLKSKYDLSACFNWLLTPTP